MLNSEVIQRVQSLYSRGVQSDDSRLTPRHIYNKLISVRSRLLTQKANKRQLISQWNYQVLPCVELVLAPIHECPCLPPIGCSILKSKYPLPKPLVNLSNHLINYVTSIDGSINYDMTTWKEKKYKKGNKYTSATPDYWIKDNHLYTTYKRGPKIITLELLAEDPVELSQFPSFCGETEESCVSYLDLEFPLESGLIDTLIELSVGELIQIFSQSTEDLTNTTTDTNASQQGNNK